MTNKNFCLGISKPLNILDRNVRKLIRYTLENNIYLHTSITYPINFVFFKIFLNKNKRNNINFICKILADSFDNFEHTVNLTLKNFSIKKIHTLQLVNLPLENPEKRDFLSIKSYDFNKILANIKKLKQRNKIEKVYLQIFAKDDLEFCRKIVNYFDGFAFYSNIEEIHLKHEVYNFIVKKNIPCILLSIFGNPTKKKILNQNLHTNSYIFSQSHFSKNTIAVGRTVKVERLKEIIEINHTNKITFKPKFKKSNEIQDTSSNYYKKYKVTNNLYILFFLLKCFIKLMIGQKLWFFLKKKFKNYEN